jgi:hypothetical protein
MLTALESTCQTTMGSVSLIDSTNRISISVPTVKAMIKDIELGKGYKAQLDVANHSIFVLNEKIQIKDFLISNLEKKEVNYKAMIENQEGIITQKDIIIKGSDKQISMLNKKILSIKLKSNIAIGVCFGLGFLLGQL